MLECFDEVVEKRLCWEFDAQNGFHLTHRYGDSRCRGETCYYHCRYVVCYKTCKSKKVDKEKMKVSISKYDHIFNIIHDFKKA